MFSVCMCPRVFARLCEHRCLCVCGDQRSASGTVPQESSALRFETVFSHQPCPGTDRVERSSGVVIAVVSDCG